MPSIQRRRIVLAVLLTAAMVAGGRATDADTSADKQPTGLKPQGPDGATQVASFDGVTWDGPGASLDQLKGKTVLALTYVTWCPKCNLWAPEKLDDVKQAIAGKPVVVLAISTDVAPARAREYMTRRGFVGPNIFHGSDPQLAKSFGFTNEFFNYAIFNAQGELATSGNFGSGIVRGDKDKAVAKAAFDRADEGPGQVPLHRSQDVGRAARRAVAHGAGPGGRAAKGTAAGGKVAQSGRSRSAQVDARAAS